MLEMTYDETVAALVFICEDEEEEDEEGDK